ncbi:DUF5686 family protein [Bacteroidales bacterium OttesenSCG-928-L03]|nr:DUF5686 family protein [Bacteroidales bacterium OttesenSCG-928-L03]
MRKISGYYPPTKKSLFFLLLALLILSPAALLADEMNKADSIIQQVFDHHDFYGEYIQSYDAEVYLKGTSYVEKRNWLYRHAPDFLNWDRKGNDNLTEAFIDLHFEAPNRYVQQIIAINGMAFNTEDIQKRVMQFLNINIYQPSRFEKQIFIPGKKEAQEYYRFRYISSRDTLGHTMHKIEIIPKFKSNNLVKGHLEVVDELWTIYSFNFRGKLDFSRYWIESEFGLPEQDFLLPRKTRIRFEIDLLGNKVTNHYTSSYNYSRIERYKNPDERKTVEYDLTKYFHVHIDSVPVVRDSAFWINNRPFPLNDEEHRLFEKALQNQNKSDTVKNKPWYFTKGIIAPRNFWYSGTQYSYSGLLNPLKLSYSKADGIKYWQEFRIRKRFQGGREISFNPNLGYLFQKKELYINASTKWMFNPRRLGELSLTLGNRNNTYNNAIIRQIEEKMPHGINFDDFNLDYYRHYYSNLRFSYELTNGLMIKVGNNFDLFKPVKKKGSNKEQRSYPEPSISSLADIDDDVNDLIYDKYQTFAPALEVSYTPHMYYRRDGKRKVYVGSHWPTFSVSYGRGIEGVLNSNSNYERLEVSAQQNIPLGKFNSFQYYVGSGKFINDESFFFSTFTHFQRRNFPESWSEPMGGVFQLLKNEYYFAANSYVQGHFMYESPFVLLKLFRRVSRDILTERFYLSQLYTPALPCYTEIGYGFGNYIGNIGFFASFIRGQYHDFGIKASFELGR